MKIQNQSDQNQKNGCKLSEVGGIPVEWEVVEEVKMK